MTTIVLGELKAETSAGSLRFRAVASPIDGGVIITMSGTRNGQRRQMRFPLTDIESHEANADLERRTLKLTGMASFIVRRMRLPDDRRLGENEFSQGLFDFLNLVLCKTHDQLIPPRKRLAA